MNTTRFLLQRFLAGLALIAIGFAGLVAIPYMYEKQWIVGEYPKFILALLLWLCGGAMIGAGVFHPFRRTSIGALLGLTVQVLLALLVQILMRFSGGSGGG